MIEYFVQLTAKKLNKKYQRIDQDDIRSLCDYDWRGNVRELQKPGGKSGDYPYGADAEAITAHTGRFI